MTINAALLNGLRNHIVDMASYGRYMINGVWYTAAFNSNAVQSNGAVHITFYIERQSGDAPATKFQIMSQDGVALVEKVEDVYFQQFMEKVLIRFKLGVNVGSGA